MSSVSSLLVFLPKIAGVDVGELKGVVKLRIGNEVLGGPVLEGPVLHVERVAHNLQWQDGAISFSCINLLLQLIAQSEKLKSNSIDTFSCLC